MSGDATDRGAKPPRTLFSLGRPGASGTTTEADPEAVGPNGATDAAAPAEAVELACGACGTTLHPGAAFCGECGTPVARVDEEPFDLVEEVHHEHLEELPGDGAPAVMYADAVEAPIDVADGMPVADGDDPHGGTVIAQPAAVLYADPSQAEPLPPTPEGSFAISEPTYGTADGTLGEGEASTDPAADAGATEAGDGATWAAAGAGAAAGYAAAEATATPDPFAPASTDAVAETTEVPAAETAAVVAPEWTDGSDAAAASTDVAPEAVPLDGTAVVEPVPAMTEEPTTVLPPAAPVAAGADAGAAGTGASVAYGATPPEGKKSRTGLIIGVAAAIIALLVIGGIVIAASGGNKDGNVQTAQQASTTTAAPASSTTTTAAPSSSTTAPSSSTTPTTQATTSTGAPATETTVSPVTTAPVVVTPTTPRPTISVAPTTAPILPGRIEANPPAGGQVNVPKGGSTTISLTNVGNLPASCALTGSNGITVSQNCSPSIAPGATVVVTVTAAPTKEGLATVTGVLEGSGTYLLTVNVQNG